MKPIPADKNDPKVKVHDILMGVQEKKDNGRVALVMSLVSLYQAIDELEIEGERDRLGKYFCNIITEAKFTDRERELFNFEVRK
jgi:hypothetical protein